MEFRSCVDWKGAIWQITPFVETKLYSIFKETVLSAKWYLFVTKECIALTILVKAKGAIC